MIYNIFIYVCMAYTIFSLIKTGDFKKLTSSVTLKIALLNICCFIVTLGGHLFARNFANNFTYTIEHFQIYRLFTSLFYHYGFQHIFCNMISLMVLGLAIETTYGKKKFIALYFSTGIIGNFISIIIHGVLHNNVLSAGASSAICGLIGYIIAGNLKKFKPNVVIMLIAPIFVIGIINGNVDNISHISAALIGVTLGLIGI